MNIREKLDIYFSLVEDPRNQSYVKYKLSDLLFLTLCGVICGFNEIAAIIEFGEEREEFFQKHSNMEQIPCSLTLMKVLRLLDPEYIELCLSGIIRNVFEVNTNDSQKQICIDGKTIKSTVMMKEYEKPLHIVTALLADYSISLGTIVVNSKSNEIPAVRELLDLIDCKDAVITLDAMHCQKETLEKIVEHGGDYVVQLKKNQSNFYEDVCAMFDDNYRVDGENRDEYEIYETLEKGHGRIERRTCYVLKNIEYFTDYLASWRGLKKIFAVKRIVEIAGKTSEEISCYLSSKDTSAENLLSYTRKHWQIESFNWLLDVNYGEDRSRVRGEKIQICLNIVRKHAISILKTYINNNPVKRKPLSANMRKCMMNPDYLEQVLRYFANRRFIT